MKPILQQKTQSARDEDESAMMEYMIDRVETKS